MNVLLDELVVDGFTLHVSGTEEHSGCKVVLVVNDVHCIKTDIFLLNLFFFMSVQYNNFIALFGCHGFFITAKSVADSLFADSFYMDEVLFLLVEVFGSEIGVRGGFPGPACTYLSKKRSTLTRWSPAFLNSLGESWPLISN